MADVDYSYKLKRSFSTFLTFFLFLGFFVPTGLAQSTTTTTTTTNTGDIDTLIIVNGGVGDDPSHTSTIDAAIFSTIAKQTGAILLYTDQGDVTPELLNHIKELEQKYDIQHVVIGGGESVVSDQAQTSLEQWGEGKSNQANYDVTRIAGTTATGTSLAAAEYFYGPEVLKEATVVTYGGDTDKEAQETIHLASETTVGPIILVDESSGLSADAAETIHDLGVDKLNIVTDNLATLASLKEDIAATGAQVGTEISGTPAEVVTKLEADVKADAKTGETIQLVEEGQAPPYDPNSVVFFYKDVNNDNVDDNTGEVLDGIGRGLYNDFKKDGKTPDDISYWGDNAQVLKTVEEKLKSEGIKVSVAAADNPSEYVQAVVQFNQQEATNIAQFSETRKEEFKEEVKKHAADFVDRLPSMIAGFERFYNENKEKLTAEQLELSAKVLDENSKGDPVAQWQLMLAFANTYRHDQFISTCQGNADCVNAQVRDEQQVGVDEKIRLNGLDTAKGVANLEEGKKVGLLADIDPLGLGRDIQTKADERYKQIQADMQNLVDQGVKPEELATKYIEFSKKQAENVLFAQIVKETEARKAAGQKVEVFDPSKLTEEQRKEAYSNRLALDSVAIRSGIITPEEYRNALAGGDTAKLAEVGQKFGNCEKIQTALAAGGVRDTQYMPPEQWVDLYGSITATGGKISADQIKASEALTTAGKTYDVAHLGETTNMQAPNYDPKTGTVSWINPVTGQPSSAVYKQGELTYTNEKGETFTGTTQGQVLEHTASGYHPAEGWIPPADYQTPGTYPTPTYTYPTPGGTYPSPTAYVYPSPTNYPTPTGSYPTPTEGHSYSYPSPSYTYPSPTGSYTTPPTYAYPTPGTNYPSPPTYGTPSYPTPSGTYGTPSYATPSGDQYSTPSYTYPTPSYGTPSYGTPSEPPH